ncbi:hypothetical protein B7494_g375 [Chlorociboria aeruginascens]|nr:hypothetical protein B7494_g375 [Chlorociboria aeruginascens]
MSHESSQQAGPSGQASEQAGPSDQVVEQVAPSDQNGGTKVVIPHPTPVISINELRDPASRQHHLLLTPILQFLLFPALPAELRQMIWTASLPVMGMIYLERVITTLFKYSKGARAKKEGKWIPKRRENPIALSVCRESRYVTNLRFTFIEGSVQGKGYGAYVDFNTDIVCLFKNAGVSWGSDFAHIIGFSMLPQAFANLQYLALFSNNSKISAGSGGPLMIKATELVHLKNLKEICFAGASEDKHEHDEVRYFVDQHQGLMPTAGDNEETRQGRIQRFEELVQETKDLDSTWVAPELTLGTFIYARSCPIPCPYRHDHIPARS